MTWPLITTACCDCGVGTITIAEWYMVRDSLWECVWRGRRKSWYGRVDGQEILCIGCLEKRLGRTLCASDFDGAPVNDPNRHGMSGRLRDRLAATQSQPLGRRPDDPPDDPTPSLDEWDAGDDPGAIPPRAPLSDDEGLPPDQCPYDHYEGFQPPPPDYERLPATDDAMPKRKRGRPRGSKNKPKMTAPERIKEDA
jgi:hypothetical protein